MRGLLMLTAAPGFGYPRATRNPLWRADVAMQPTKVPMPYAMAVTFEIRGVTPTREPYQPLAQ